MALERLNEDRVETAMAFLAQTDLEYANAKSMLLRLEAKAKSMEATVYIAQQEGSVRDKEMQVRLHPEVQKVWDEYFTLFGSVENIKNQRERHVLVIELYRSVLSARKAGMTV